MRTILIAGIAAAGIGLAATSGASAAPVNGAVIGDLATATDNVTSVRWWGHRPWGYGYYHLPWGYGYGYGYYHRPWGYGYGYSYRETYPFDRQLCCRF